MDIHTHEGIEIVHIDIHITFYLHVAKDRRIVNEVVDLAVGRFRCLRTGNTRGLITDVGAHKHRLTATLLNVGHNPLALLSI